ncbi:PQQ-dependent sugar dehydrogenase [Mangrovimonas sp. ST2L15]|uniref:PQQ-dependent sugar dehydrogenase n=1 Tax=Mangrovimonas sp. ST2L15 TaxID=1645916 RepID=UPI0006B41385|nr:PQQ-dependent sugar dehydrogenase [Mangrovimonas sp. ST2L15]
MIKKMVIPLLLGAFLTGSCQQKKKKTLAANQGSQELSYELIVPDLHIPWGFQFLPGNSILYTEKEGKLVHFINGKKTDIKGLPEIYVRGQGGLLDLQLHPNYAQNGWLYFTYASPAGDKKGGHTALMRARIKNNQLVDKQLLYKAQPNSTDGRHFGSRIEFDDQGYVYFSIGERGNRDVNPQDITRDGGKIYRLKDDGTIPDDNPFSNQSNAKKAIYTYGHRNPQGMKRNPVTQDIWIHEHGPMGGDEINIIKPGKNYGWPKASFGKNYNGSQLTPYTTLPDIEPPIHYWDPSIAPSGMVFITSDKYGNWKGNLLVGSLKFQYLALCFLDGNSVVKEKKLLEGIGRVRSLEQGPDGYIYAGIEGLGIIKLQR